jgi:hypothetical protein
MMKLLALKLAVVIATVVMLSIIPVASEEVAGDQDFARHYGRISFDVARGVKIALGNRTTGRITVNAWDKDVIEAHAISSRGDEVVVIGRSEISGSQRFLIKADYADLDQPGTPTSRVSDPPTVDGSNLQVHLELNVPRYTEIDLIEVWRSNVDVTGVETRIAVRGERSSILLKRVGAADIQNRSGNVEIDGVNGLALVSTISGAIRVSDARSAVRAVSISGPVEIKCVRGRVDVSNTDASIELINIDGDVDAIATNSSVRLAGNLHEGGRYYLKSMSGRVEALVTGRPQGFNATLSSYRGIIESDFDLNSKQAHTTGSENRRLAGRVGNGNAQITLDSFEGLVRLTKIESAVVQPCR